MNANRRTVLQLAGLGAAAMLGNCIPSTRPRTADAANLRPVDLTGRPRVKIAEGSLARTSVDGGRSWSYYRLPNGNLVAAVEVKIVDPASQEHVRQVESCDTGDGTLKIYVPIRKLGPKSYTPDGYERFARVDVVVERRDFDVVHRQTGEVLHRVRWV